MAVQSLLQILLLVSQNLKVLILVATFWYRRRTAASSRATLGAEVYGSKEARKREGGGRQVRGEPSYSPLHVQSRTSARSGSGSAGTQKHLQQRVRST